MSSSKGKGKGKRAKKGGGGTKKGGGEAKRGGGEEVWRPDIRGDSCVEVIFVDEHLRFFKMLDSANDRIPSTFLNDILIECYTNWNGHIPGIEALDLVARPFPLFPSNECTFLDWNGVILVELKEEKVDLGVVRQLSSSTGELLAANFSLQASIDSVDAKVEAATKMAKEREEDLEKLVKKLERGHEEAKANTILLEARIKLLEDLAVQSKEQLQEVHKVLTGHVILTNQVKRRVILEKARNNIITLLGKPSLQPGENWKDFFKSFQLDDWQAIFGDEKDVTKMEKVKKLLGVGSVEANKNIHNIEYSHLRESIFAVEVEKDQAAWMWILGFVFSVTMDAIMDSN